MVTTSKGPNTRTARTGTGIPTPPHPPPVSARDDHNPHTPTRHYATPMYVPYIPFPFLPAPTSPTRVVPPVSNQRGHVTASNHAQHAPASNNDERKPAPADATSSSLPFLAIFNNN